MNKSQWKPLKEIKHIVEPYQNVTILSCCFCANISGTGGVPGIRIMQDILNKMNKNMVKSECVLACCESDLMDQAIKRQKKAISKSDALVVLSCAAGVKAAFLSRPDIPIVSPLDPVGSVAISHTDDPVSRSVCTICGSCVIPYTGGICPVSECPAKSKFKPCVNAPKEGTKCVVNSDRICIWREIEKRGDMERLKRLHELQKSLDRKAPYEAEDFKVFPPDFMKPMLPGMRRRFGWFGARSGFLEKLIALYR